MNKGQSILEYVVLLSIILAGILIMQIYVKRAYQGRLKQEADTLGQQYAPKHTSSLIVSQTNITSESYTGGETSQGDAVPDGMTVTFSQTNTTFNRQEAVDSFATE